MTLLAPAGRTAAVWTALRKHPLTFVAASTLAGQFATAITGPLLVRMVGVDKRGELALAAVLVLLFTQVGMFGLPSAVSYFLASRGLTARELALRFGWQFAALAAGVAVLTGVVLSVALRGGGFGAVHGLALFIAASVPFYMTWFLFSIALLGEQRFTQFATARFVNPVFYLVAIVALTAQHGHPSVRLCFVLNSAGAVIGTAVSATFLLRARPVAASPRPTTGVPTLGELVRFGRAAAVDSIAPVDGLSLDQIIIGVLLTSHALGLYVIGYAFESLPVLLLTSVSWVCGPRIAAVVDAPVRAAQIRKWSVTAVVVGISACALIEAILSPLLLFAFGTPARPAIPIARVLIAAGFFLGYRKVGSSFLIASGRPARSTMAEIVGVVVLVCAAVPLTHRFGAIGTAWALFGAGAAAAITQVGLLLPLLDGHTPRHMLVKPSSSRRYP